MLRRQSGVEQGLKRVLCLKRTKSNPGNYPEAYVSKGFGMFLARVRPRVSFAKRGKLFCEPLIYILQKLERTHVKSITELVKHSDTWAVST